MKELEAKQVDVAGMREAMAPHVLYAGETSLNIRTYYRDAEERELMAYNRWVVDVYNPSRTAVIAEGEREQVRITNEYREMMGYTVDGRAGPRRRIEAIDGLERREDPRQGPTRSRARACTPCASTTGSSRARAATAWTWRSAATSTTRRPPTPPPARAATSPFDRMTTAGYRAAAASENIARAGSALDAHQAWLYSSGHHRNILSDWTDMGVGRGRGTLWTQNFGNGGGAEPDDPGPRGPTTTGDK